MLVRRTRNITNILLIINARFIKSLFQQLKNAGRVKVIAFTKNHTAGEIDQLIVSHFPTLVGRDLSR